MAHVSLKVRAEALGKSLDDLADDLEDELNGAISDIAQGAYAKIVSEAQAKLKTTRQDYLNGLEFIDLGNNSYLITLNGKAANATENGYSGFSMKEGMLNSNKTVEVGKRAGEPWVRTNQTDGSRYAVVPIEKKQSAMTSDLASEMKKMQAMNAEGRKQRLTKIFKNAEGSPIHGKVAVGHSENPLLDNLVKYQYIHQDTGRVSSLYISYRIVSDKSKGWNHPGWVGSHFFEEAEKYVEEQLDQIIKLLL